MDMNFLGVLRDLGANAAFRVANAARPPANYIWNTFLPERPRTTYEVRSGYMTIRSTMAGLVGADSPYPPTGMSEISTFLEQSAKIANRVTIPEMAMRELQTLLSVIGQQSDSTALIRDTILNFLDKLVVQSHLDTFEYLRGEALTTGAITWTFNQKSLAVNYGVPAANLNPNRTGTASYDQSASVFWADHRLARLLLKHQVRAIIAHPDTIDAIVANPANNIVVVAQDPLGVTQFVKMANTTTGAPTTDARDRVSVIAYGDEGEVLDPANPGKTISVPFCSKGKIVYIGNPLPQGFQVGQGSTASPLNELPIGYTHLAPTVEGGGAPGRWARLRAPEDFPWSLEGVAVTNGLQVIEVPEKLVVLSSDIV